MLDFFKLNEKTLISNMKTYKSINLTGKCTEYSKILNNLSGKGCGLIYKERMTKVVKIKKQQFAEG